MTGPGNVPDEVAEHAAMVKDVFQSRSDRNTVELIFTDDVPVITYTRTHGAKITTKHRPESIRLVWRSYNYGPWILTRTCLKTTRVRANGTLGAKEAFEWSDTAPFPEPAWLQALVVEHEPPGRW